MIRSSFAVAAAFLTTLVACSTPYSLRHSDPILSYTTTRPAEEVKKCIFKKWDAHLSGLKESVLDGVWQIQYSDSLPASTKALVTVEQVEAETKVTYYNSSKKLRAHRLENEVNECK